MTGPILCAYVLSLGLLAALVVLGLHSGRRRRAETALREAKDAAEHASRAKGEFLAYVSHEIRNPLNAILGMTELCLDGAQDAEQREYLDLIRDSSMSLMALLNDVLDLSRIEAGRLELDATDFSLAHTVDTCVRQMTVLAAPKGIELRCEIAPGVPRALRGDPTRLRQVLTNLIANAVKFTDHGEVAVRVALETRQGSDVLLRFDVQDTGIGISDAQRQRIFEAFRQADPSIAREYGGSGLGLHIAARLVGLMGGHIWVDSEPGAGSVFHFTTRFEARAPVEEPQVGAELSGRAALVVDRQSASRHGHVVTLRSFGMRALAVDSTPAALGALRQAREAGRPFDLVLVDAHVSRVEGFKIVGEIRARAELGGPVLVLLVSAGERGDAARCRKMGVSVYLTRPASEGQLERALRTALSFADTHSDGAPLVTRHLLFEKETLGSAFAPAAGAPGEATPERFSTVISEVLAPHGGPDHALLEDGGLFGETAAAFLDDAAKLLASLQSALERRDASELVSAAARLRDAAANLEAWDTIEAARRLEELGAGQRWQEAELGYRTLETEIKRLQLELRS